MKKNNLLALRHSAEHVLTMAMLRLWPGKIKAAMGPPTEDGFYFDFYSEVKISEDDFPKIEKEMAKIIKEDLPITKDEMTVKQAKKFFSTNVYKGNEYKHEWLDDIKSRGEKVSIYWMGKKGKDIPETFVDICSGPHVKSTGQIKAFKLLSLAGAYWHGDEKNIMLSRIYGTAFNSKKELNEYLKLRKEMEEKDHRILGQKLELFTINEQIGAGLPIWLPKGAIIRKTIEDYLYKELSQAGYDWIYTPHIAYRKLWEMSGHWNFYSESMYPPLEVGQSLEESQKGKKVKTKEEYLLKPMNCPFHALVYNSKIRSYKDLPIKLAELGTVYRYERSGTLHGLPRVRGFTQDDAHLICTLEQMPEELSKLVKHALKMLKDFGFKDINIYLSTRPKKYTGTIKAWEKATKTLEYVLKKLKLKYEIDPGGGVFYGPKIDMKIKDSIGREWQCTTIQFDFNLPEKFKMTYVDKKGKKKEPYMIHRALLGSMERFFGVLIEHYGGAFPFWLSPEQIWVIPIGSKHRKYAKQVAEELKNFRVEVKEENETVSKKIRQGETQKIPYLLVVGDKEMKNKTVRVRQRGKGDIGELKLNKFLDKINKGLKNK